MQAVIKTDAIEAYTCRKMQIYL